MIFNRIKKNFLWKILIVWTIVGVALVYFMPKEYSSIFILRLILVFPLFLSGYLLIGFIPCSFINMLYCTACEYFPKWVVNIIFFIIAIWLLHRDFYFVLNFFIIPSLLIYLFIHYSDSNDNNTTDIIVHEKTQEEVLLELSDMLCSGARIYLWNGLVLETVKWNGDLYIDILGLEPKQQIEIIEKGGFLIDIYDKEHIFLPLKVNPEFDFDPLFNKKPAFNEEPIQYILDISNVASMCKVKIKNLGKGETTSYETYIKYIYKKKGYQVSHCSIPSLLMCYKGSQTLIVCCKKCDNHNQIHEKYMYQLSKFILDYSTDCSISMLERIINSEYDLECVSGIFYTTAYFSVNAQKLAAIKDIKLIENFQMYEGKTVINNMLSISRGHHRDQKKR